VPLVLVAVPFVAACQAPDFPVKRSVGLDGAHIEGKGFALDIPAGALDATHDLTIDLANFSPARATAPISPLLHLEPAGLAFAMPVTMTLATPPDVVGVVIWSRPGDEHSFDIVGTAINGKGVAQNTHFSNVGGENSLDPSLADPCSPTRLGDCPDCADGGTDQPGDSPDMGCAPAANPAPNPSPMGDACSTAPQSDCWQSCRCQIDYSKLKSYEDVSNDFLCAINPATGDPVKDNAVCPALPGLGSREYLGNGDANQPGINGADCNGYAWVGTEFYLCNCHDKALDLFLCPLPETLDQIHGTSACNSTIVYPSMVPGSAPHTPNPAKCPPGTADWTECDQHLGGYGSLTDVSGMHVACSGYDLTNGNTLRSGELELCGFSSIKFEWRQLTGTSAQCSLLTSTDGLPPMNDEQRMRCRLTRDEWAQVESTRSACGTPARQPDPNNPIGTGTPVFAILRAIDSMGVKDKQIIGQNGTRRPAREQAALCGTCPAWVRHDLGPSPVPECMPGNHGAAQHAESDALCQLRVTRDQRRMMAGGDPTVATGGCGEMIVDRVPCNLCWLHSIPTTLEQTGLTRLYVRAPNGCAVFGSGLKSIDLPGVPCDDVDGGTHCPGL
jgi:hypothetical protein